MLRCSGTIDVTLGKRSHLEGHNSFPKCISTKTPKQHTKAVTAPMSCISIGMPKLAKISDKPTCPNLHSRSSLLTEKEFPLQKPQSSP